MFGKIGTTELLLILGIALLIFGPSKLPKLGKAIGVPTALPTILPRAGRRDGPKMIKATAKITISSPVPIFNIDKITLLFHGRKT